jgi:hypothetical protein
MAYLEWIVDRAPAWIRRGLGEGWLASVGLVLDGFAETTRQAIRARFPTGAPPDALTTLGGERQSPRITALFYELDDAYAERLRLQWEKRELLGAKTGLEAIVAAQGFVTFEVLDQQEWSAATPWMWSYVHVSQPHPWTTPGNWDDPGLWDNGLTWDSSATVSEVENVRAVTRPWVPAHAKCWMVIDLEGEIWDSGGLWDNGDFWNDGAAVVTWQLHPEP